MDLRNSVAVAAVAVAVEVEVEVEVEVLKEGQHEQNQNEMLRREAGVVVEEVVHLQQQEMPDSEVGEEVAVEVVVPEVCLLRCQIWAAAVVEVVALKF